MLRDIAGGGVNWLKPVRLVLGHIDNIQQKSSILRFYATLVCNRYWEIIS